MRYSNSRPSEKVTHSLADLCAPLPSSLMQEGTVWLDSSARSGDWGRRSILAWRPSGEISLNHGMLAIRRGTRIETRRGDIHQALVALDERVSGATAYAIGYIAYEATLPFLGLQANEEGSVPVLHFFLYDAGDVSDKGDGSDLASEWSGIPSADATHAARVSSTLSRNQYLERVERIKHYIHEGDIYQANFTCRFDVRSTVSPVEVYSRLRSLNPASYSAFMNFGDYQILSSSPERMLLRDGETVSTSPIKGTIGRGRNAQEDRAQIEALLGSDKDRAEHLMIVDLERNDLGKIAEVGSVSVDALFRPESQASMIHLVSDVSARIGPDLPMSEVFTALLPGGSITGAPKRRAVEIIGQTEATPRSVYTGCIGYMHGSYADFNIAIRTIICQNGIYQVHAGGGIVADSDPEAEYQEMLLKASNLFRAIGVAEDDIACLSR